MATWFEQKLLKMQTQRMRDYKKACRVEDDRAKHAERFLNDKRAPLPMKDRTPQRRSNWKHGSGCVMSQEVRGQLKIRRAMREEFFANIRGGGAV